MGSENFFGRVFLHGPSFLFYKFFSNLNFNFVLGGLSEGTTAILGTVWMLGLGVDMMELSYVVLGWAVRQ